MKDNLIFKEDCMQRSVKEIKEIKEVLNYTQPEALFQSDTLFLLDLDFTLVDQLSVIGSDPWFVKLIQHACEIVPDSKEAIAMVIALYHAVQHHVKMRIIEVETRQVINELKKNYTVLGLTARGDAIKEATLWQLNEIDIHLDITFCDGANKGEMIEPYLKESLGKFKYVVMVDDKEKHLLHVKKVVEALGMEFIGLRYGFLDEKAKQVDMEMAQYELAYLKNRFSDEVNVIIDELKLMPKESKIRPLILHSLFRDNNPQQSGQSKQDEMEVSAHSYLKFGGK
jgi:hypothetical protein